MFYLENLIQSKNGSGELLSEADLYVWLHLLPGYRMNNALVEIIECLLKNMGGYIFFLSILV
jgi:hypothetical protein